MPALGALSIGFLSKKNKKKEDAEDDFRLITNGTSTINAPRSLVFPLSMVHMIRRDAVLAQAAGRHCNFASRNGPCRLSLKKKVLINMPLCRKCVVELNVTILNSE